MKIKISLLLILLVPLNLLAQSQLQGTIIDSKTKEKLIGANIYLVDLLKGTVSNLNGNFTINNLKCTEVSVKFSFVGYETQLKKIKLPLSKNLQIELISTAFESAEIFVSGGSYSTQHQNAIKIESLGSTLIMQSNASSLAEALSSAAGVDMLSAGGAATKPVIRGLSMTNILFVNNGVKLENFQFSDHHPYVSDEFGIDKIEVIKGPASILFGSDAVGGVINLIREMTEENGISGDYNLKYHSNTQGIISNLGVNMGNDKLFGGIRIGMKSHKDYLEASGKHIPNTRFNDKSLKLYTGIKNSTGVYKLYFDYSKMEVGKAVEPAFALITENSRKNNVWYQDLENYVLNSRNTLFIGNLKFTADVNWQMNNRTLNGVLNSPITKPVDMQLNTLAYTVKSYWPIGEKSELITGFQGAYRTNRNADVPLHTVPDADLTDFAVLSLFKKTFFQNIKIQLGIRYDFRNIYLPLQAKSGNVNNLTSSDLIPELEKHYEDFSFTAGATYNLNDIFLVRANFASAFRTPNLAELSQDGYHAERYELGNRNLESQRNYETDLSFHVHLDKLKIDLASFYNTINNYIFLSPTPNYNLNNDQIYQYLQSDAHIYGGEIALDYAPFPFLNLSADYSYLVGESKTGENLPFIPQNKQNTNIKLLTKQIKWANEIFFQLHTHYAFEQDKASIYETTTSNYFLIDLSLGGKLKYKTNNLEFNLLIDNLLNEEYFDHLSILKTYGFYNPGRNISLNLKYIF